jgi:hypothetical protein
MTDEARTAEQRTQDFTAMGHSVDLINAIVAGDHDEWETDERQDCCDRNVAHLEIMVAKDDWDGEDMSDANAAISAGQGYTA